MSVIDKYLDKVDIPERVALERIRRIVHDTLPSDIEEVITYGMPGFKYKGKYLIAFAPFQDHMSIFPGAHPIEALSDSLKDFIVAKGTIQFTLKKELPEPLIKEIITVRKNDIDSVKPR
jgi:uncharacterized protein YdhG (YjbR/CyaY superfamily)